VAAGGLQLTELKTVNGAGGLLVGDEFSIGAYHGVVMFERVVVDHRIMGGVPCVRGTRIPVATVVGMVAEGMTVDEILRDFPQLSDEDIKDALHYAAAAVDERELPLRPAG